MADKKYKLKFGMSDGTEKSVEFTAPQGESGITPVVAVSDITGGHRVTITTGDNVQTIDVLDGKNGDPGKDGITPTVSVTEIEGGHRVTITTGSNVQSFDVMDGKNSEGGGTADEVAWENVTGKPFNESLTGTAVANGDTLSWDGNKDAMPIVVTPNNYNKWIYVSDNVPTMEQIGAGHTIAFKAYNGSEININITPSESENYIYVGDIDGQYLYIIKKPCTVGSMVFERTGIYFYSDSKATIYTCRLTINGYTFTEMGSIKDAYIPQTIARKSDIPQGGGAQVQSDYTQHDAAQPDYIQHRPFWPEWSPVLIDFAFPQHTVVDGYIQVYSGHYATGNIPAPIEGRRYTFLTNNTVHGGPYSGIAKKGSFEWADNVYSGIGIVAEQDSNVLAIYSEDSISPKWYFNLPSDESGTNNSGTIAVIEGEKPYNKLSVSDDVIALPGNPAGVHVVQDLTEQYKKLMAGDEKTVNKFAALTGDFQITIDMGGAEYTLTQNEVLYARNVELMGYTGDVYMYGEAPLAAIFYESAFDKYLLALLDLNALGMAPITAKSIKINYPGIFAPIIPTKKMPAECMPGQTVFYVEISNLSQQSANYFYREKDFADHTKRVTKSEVMAAFATGGGFLIQGEMEGLPVILIPTMAGFDSEYAVVAVMMPNFAGSSFTYLLYTAEYTG